jgi:hypothetical protein
LQRGVDFPSAGPSFRKAAERAAAGMGKRVVMVRDRRNPQNFTWIQFVDGEIWIGDPCPCGGRRLVRISGKIVRCRACNRTLMATLREEEDDDEESLVVGPVDEPEVPETLAGFRQIRLRRTEVAPDAERFIGTGLDAEHRPVVLAVRVPCVGGAPIPDESSPTRYVHEVLAAVRTDAAAEADDTGPWDLVLD